MIGLLTDVDPDVAVVDARLQTFSARTQERLERAGWSSLDDETGRWIHADIGVKRESIALELTSAYRLDRGGRWPTAIFPEDSQAELERRPPKPVAFRRRDIVANAYPGDNLIDIASRVGVPHRTLRGWLARDEALGIQISARIGGPL